MEKELKHYLNKRQGQFEERPKPEIWDKIEDRLDNKNNRFALPVFLKYAAGISAIVLVTALFAYRHGFQDGTHQNLVLTISEFEDLGKIGNVALYENILKTNTEVDRTYVDNSRKFTRNSGQKIIANASYSDNNDIEGLIASNDDSRVVQRIPVSPTQQEPHILKKENLARDEISAEKNNHTVLDKTAIAVLDSFSASDDIAVVGQSNEKTNHVANEENDLSPEENQKELMVVEYADAPAAMKDLDAARELEETTVKVQSKRTANARKKSEMVESSEYLDYHGKYKDSSGSIWIIYPGDDEQSIKVANGNYIENFKYYPHGTEAKKDEFTPFITTDEPDLRYLWIYEQSNGLKLNFYSKSFTVLRSITLERKN